MALEYDYSYREWLESHPKPVGSPMKVVPNVPSRKFVFKEVAKAQAPKKVKPGMSAAEVMRAYDKALAKAKRRGNSRGTK